jgi:thiamine-phosphate pyrophosphorylase
MRLPAARPLVCLVTHGERLALRLDGRVDAIADAIVAQAAEAARAGVDLVQVRELEFAAAPLVALVARIVDAVAGTSARVLVNDRLDVALAAGAHGVHLRADSYPAARVRSMSPPGFLVGRSVHASDEAAAVAAEGETDFLVFGTVFQSASKPNGQRPAGLEALARVVDAAAGVPVLAIGGVTVGSMPLLAAAGAAGAAAIGLFLPGEAGAGRTMADTVSGLRGAFDSVGEVH